jgi:molybdopterin synthase catalytic subunit
MPVPLVAVTPSPLDLQALIQEVSGSRAGDGAVASFIGLVRDHNQGGRDTFERVKQNVPIWKHEHFEGGEVWLEGATADPDDESARQTAYRVACA